MKTLLLILTLTASAIAQNAGPRPVAPIQVSIETEFEAGSDDDWEFHRLFRGELNKLRDVAVKSQGYDVRVYLTATKLTEKQRFIGYACAVLTVTDGRKGDKLRFEIVTGPTLEGVARHVATTLDKEIFQRRRDRR